LVGKTLIATALEETWPKHPTVPVLFLGEWCRIYSRKHRWSKLNQEIIPYHWDDRKKLKEDYIFLSKIYEKLLRELANELNKVHKTSHSLRYWRIIVGPWLGYFTQIVFDRWFMISYAVANYNISNIFCIKKNFSKNIPENMEHFISLLATDQWNEKIFREILQTLKIPFQDVKEKKTTLKNNPQAKKTLFLTCVKKILNKLSGCIAQTQKYFFVKSYIPFLYRIKIQILLKQIPTIWEIPIIKLPKRNDSFKRKLIPLVKHNQNNFFEVIKCLLWSNIPRSYLEDFKAIYDIADKFTWPRNPKAIFTSNSWLDDDFFKIWAAKKIDQGTQLIIGQHGGSYGVAKFNFGEDHQIAISDKFITWGWLHPKQSKVIPVGNFKDHKKKTNWKRNGRALMVLCSIPRYSYWLYSVPVSAGQWNSYFEDQCRFIQALPDQIRRNLLIRVHPQDYGHHQMLRWKERFPAITLDDGNSSISNILKSTRLYISTYNATTYLESLRLNMPTIIFWNPIHWELRESALPYFKKLEDVGIFHKTPESAAEKMTSIWDNVKKWWEQKKVQSVRQEFCECFSKESQLIPNKIAETLSN